MQGLWLQEQKLTYRDDLPVPTPPPGEALVRVELAGICRTDIELIRGYYPYSGIPGHEFVGTVTQAPGAPHLKGQRVVGEINAVCGRCPECRRGESHHCRRRTVLGIVNRGGAFAEFLALPADNLHVVPDGVTNRQAVFTEPLAAALRIREQVLIGPGELVLLIGAGKLGQLVARSLAATTSRLHVVGRYPRQRELLASLNATIWDAIPADTERFGLVVEATGSPEGLQLALDKVRPGGTIVVKSTYAGQAGLDFSKLVVDEICLVGSRCGPFEPALAMMEQGHFESEPLIEEEFPMSSALEAFDCAQATSAMKVLLRGPGSPPQ